MMSIAASRALSRSGIPTDLMPPLVATLLACAEIARTKIRPYFRAEYSVTNKSNNGYDPVTEADRAAEEAIRRHIKQCFPHHGILGEEFGHETGSSPIHWVIDPIDGTRAFLCGAPTWGTLIAVNDGHRPILGLMDQAYTCERFLGSPAGAFSVGPDTRESLDVLPRLTTSGITELSLARMACTDPSMFKTQEQQEAFSAIHAATPVCRFGLDCYGYVMLASGHVDLVVEASLKPYDIQALIPIVEGAGGVVTDWNGGDAQDGGQVVASASPKLHEEALDLLRRATS